MVKNDVFYEQEKRQINHYQRNKQKIIEKITESLLQEVQKFLLIILMV